MSSCMRCGRPTEGNANFCEECKGIIQPVENIGPTYSEQYQNINTTQEAPYQQQPYPPQYQQPYPQQPPYPQPPYQQPYPPFQPQPEQATKSYASLILGIIGIVTSFLFALVGHITSIIGIVLGVKEYKARKDVAGLVLSIIGEVLSVISSIIGAVTMLSVVL